MGQSATFYFHLELDQSGQASTTLELPVDSATGFAFSVFTPEKDVQVVLFDPKGDNVSLAHAKPVIFILPK